jgi:chromosome segregation ATPase
LDIEKEKKKRAPNRHEINKMEKQCKEAELQWDCWDLKLKLEDPAEMQKELKEKLKAAIKELKDFIGEATK